MTCTAIGLSTPTACTTASTTLSPTVTAKAQPFFCHSEVLPHTHTPCKMKVAGNPRPPTRPANGMSSGRVRPSGKQPPPFHPYPGRKAPCRQGVARPRRSVQGPPGKAVPATRFPPFGIETQVHFGFLFLRRFIVTAHGAQRHVFHKIPASSGLSYTGNTRE